MEGIHPAHIFVETHPQYGSQTASVIDQMYRMGYYPQHSEQRGKQSLIHFSR